MRAKAKPEKKKERKPLTEAALAARRAAGKKGMEARWGGKGERTVQVRAYESDAETLKGMAPRTADAIRELLEGQ